jgi:ubiquinone/menaquinone biosynthesis C-methylase UbiE
MTVIRQVDVKKQKAEFWSKPGAATVYEKNVSSSSPFIRIKNHVEQRIVTAHATGRILDAGTGTGRFAIPLARMHGNSVVALDYSADMLALNKQLSAPYGGALLDYVRGDIEQLPFRTSSFDAVVSITVVRHFPQWRRIVQEYVRVLKPGGALVFEMCSGDHIAAANRFSPRFGAQFRRDGFLSYEAEVRQSDLVRFLESIGVQVSTTSTYDYLNSNAFLKLATVTDLGYRVALKAIKTILSVPPLWRLAAWMELHVLGRLSPACSYNYLIVARKL